MSIQTDPGETPNSSRWDVVQSGRTDERILLLLLSGRDRDLFAEGLSDHEVVVADPEPGEPLPAFDLDA